VPRQEYLRCAELRKQVCSIFQDVEISEANAAALPAADADDETQEACVPQVFVDNAIALNEAADFHPCIEGPAALRDPGIKAPDSQHICADLEEEPEPGGDAGDRVASEHAVHAGMQMEDLFAENVIGLDEAHHDDPVRQFAVLQRKLELVKQEGEKLFRAQDRAAQQGHSGLAAPEIAGQEQMTLEACLDLRDVAKRMNEKYQAEITAAYTQVFDEKGNENCRRALHVNAGSLLNSFDATSWISCLPEFFYGDQLLTLNDQQDFRPKTCFIVYPIGKSWSMLCPAMLQSSPAESTERDPLRGSTHPCTR